MRTTVAGDQCATSHIRQVKVVVDRSSEEKERQLIERDCESKRIYRILSGQQSGGVVRMIIIIQAAVEAATATTRANRNWYYVFHIFIHIYTLYFLIVNDHVLCCVFQLRANYYLYYHKYV